LERAAICGRLDDYVAAAEASAALVRDEPGALASWKLRVRVLTQIHRFADARQALAKAAALTRDETEWADLAAALDEATGDHARAAAYRERAAREWPTP